MSKATIDVAVTHEIVIDGEKSWIKYGVVQESDAKSATELENHRKELTEHVNEGVLRTIQETVSAVRSFQEK